MNNSFMICFLILMLLLLVFNRGRMAAMNKTMKRVHLMIYAVTFGLLVWIAMGYTVPMPTKYLNNRLSPYILSILSESR